jgi:hypothetical protein
MDKQGDAKPIQPETSTIEKPKHHYTHKLGWYAYFKMQREKKEQTIAPQRDQAHDFSYIDYMLISGE